MPASAAFNFGVLPMPAGYSVAWYECHEHYQATGPNEWEGSISVDPYWCRRQAIAHAASNPPAESTTPEPS